jgi:predicted short-subunit dehydrogenase-like oxidoreductase (DUF2520 family)
MKDADNTINIAIIGAGRVGSTIAGYLVKKNLKKLKITAISSKTKKSLSRSQETIKGDKQDILFTLNNIEAVKRANCLLLCTPDDLIEPVCNDIFSHDKIQANDYMAIHLSGSKKINVLAEASKKGASVGCMHPIKSFASSQESIKSLGGTTYGLTFQTIKEEETLKRLVKALNGKHIIIENDSKPLYHAITCIASNYLVSLIDYSLSMADKIKIPLPDILEPILKLSEGTIDNIKKMGSKKSLTGPIARGDASTIRAHIESIRQHMGLEDLKIYKALGRHTSKIARNNKWLDEDKYFELMEILK